MDTAQFESEVMAIDWGIFKCGPFYEPAKVPAALMALALAEQETKEGIYQGGAEAEFLANAKIESDLLFAIGNDHRGTYYPVVKWALPFIVQVALYGNHMVARNCAINALIDLYCFGSEYGSEALPKFVKGTIEKTVIENKDNFIKFVNDDIRNKSLIEDLLSIAGDEHKNDDGTS